MNYFLVYTVLMSAFGGTHGGMILDDGNKTGNLFNQNVLIRHRNRDSQDNLHFDRQLSTCQTPAKCVDLANATCMGAKLPYQSTTLNLTGLSSLDKVHEQLQLYQYLRYVPKCWAVIQPFLCALYMPKCEKDVVDLPSREMCRITLQPCKLLYNNSIFPSFFDCDNRHIFPSKCKNEAQELKFNTTGYCMLPLIKTDQTEWFYPDVEGCGLRCMDSLYTENEHKQIHKLIGYCALVCLLLNLFTIVTFLIDWTTANKYPALTIFYMNICFFISYSGWSIQFLGADTRQDIVCKKDETLRKSEPSASENLSCVVVFVLVYYFLIAGMVWFVIFSYTWHKSSLQALGKSQERVDKKRAYFHLVAWSLPLVLTITTMALGEIDGDFVTGICFVGMVSFAARTGLLLTPLAAAMVVACYIIIRGLILLIKVKIDSREFLSEHSSKKIRSNIVRMGVFTSFMIIFSIITFVYHGYVSSNSENWHRSLRNYITCKLTSFYTDFSHCRQESRPSVAMLQLQLLAVFGAGIAMASWVWCGATIHSWDRYIRKKFRCEIDTKPRTLQKHQIIAEAFAKRRKYNDGGRISIECQNYTDPVGLHFDLNSAASNGLSTTWANNLPRLVTRRGAVVTDSSQNNSLDSEVSITSLRVRQWSIESRCNSGDSQLSVQIAELKATRKVGRGRRRIRRHRRVSRQGKRHESTSSLNSHFELINALNNTKIKRIEPNLNRRGGNAGLEIKADEVTDSLNRINVPPEPAADNRFRTGLENHLDLADKLLMDSVRKGLNIRELSSSDDEKNYNSGTENSDSDSSPELKLLNYN